MESSIDFQTLIESPFPGLRAFETEESLLFFGREVHTEALLRRLDEGRFLAVVGASGCGKSSLVRAGLLPALFRGYLVNATSRWRFAILRPGTSPIDALAAALAKGGLLSPAQDLAQLRETLGATSGGLVEVVRKAGLAPGESLLVVVDQFEELFRFARESGPGDAASQASLFVGLLLRAVESDVPIYVTLTMRSDYQGDCAQFPGLPEALNQSQYLVPRLTRDQRREAIVRPLELVGTAATPRLVNRLLNDAGDDPDQLPVLQHALLQTYRHWKGEGPIDLANYDAIGGIENALGKHGDGILSGFTAEDQRLAEKIFRSLTTIERGRAVRRPKELGAIYDVVNAPAEPARKRVRDVISAFARREHSLLMLSSPELEPGTVVDITHESLIRKWPALRRWVQEESRSTDWYGDLARDVLRYRTEDAGLWRDPELSRVLGRRDREGWNTAWALQVSRPGDPPFAEVERFLSASSTAQAKALRRENVRRWLTSILLLLVLITVLIAGAVIRYNNQRNEAKVNRVTSNFLSVQAAYSAAQRETSEARTKYEVASHQLDQLKGADPAEQARLRTELETLHRSYIDSQNISQNAANAYQREISDLRRNQDIATSDHNALLNRIQDLQKNLNTVTAERDKLRSELASASKPADPAPVRRNEDLQAQLTAATAELNRLRASSVTQRPTAVRPTFIVLPQYSVLYLPAPFAGNVALGVGNVPDELAQRVGVYIWTNDGKTPLPEAFSGDEKRARRALGRLDKPGCSGGGTEARSCFEVRRIDAILGHQQVGRFTLGGLSYEVRATGWSSHVSGYKDSISLAIYPVAQAAR
jgi:conflict system STAND superfamily ATPase